jgi:hypothetical protein
METPLEYNTSFFYMKNNENKYISNDQILSYSSLSFDTTKMLLSFELVSTLSMKIPNYIYFGDTIKIKQYGTNKYLFVYQMNDIITSAWRDDSSFGTIFTIDSPTSSLDFNPSTIVTNNDIPDVIGYYLLKNNNGSQPKKWTFSLKYGTNKYVSYIKQTNVPNLLTLHTTRSSMTNFVLENVSG